MNTSYLLIKKIKLSGIIECISGLRIGGNTSPFSIGGLDHIIIRNPKDNKPYIPGSSLKGKLRYLTEISRGEIDVVFKNNKYKNNKYNYNPSSNPSHISVKLFGSSNNKNINIPSRVIVRDGHILNNENDFPNTSIPFAEIKTEVNIDRITASTDLRTIERVPAGAKFSLDIILNIFNFTVEETNNKHEIKTLNNEECLIKEETTLLTELLKSLRLLQEDYLGGYGSRGYGNIKIHLNELQYLDIQNAHTNLNYIPYPVHNNSELIQLLSYFKHNS